MLNSLEKVDDEGRRASLLDTLCATEDVLSMPTYATPPGISSGESTVDLRGFSFVLSTYIAIRSFKL
jgi:SWI/SNF-related matrix-associated actin-dependent regulator of chromatin subfamily A3